MGAAAERPAVKHSFVDRYALLDSPLHLLEARTKIIGFTALAVFVLYIPAGDSGGFFLSFFLMAILAGISQIPLQFIVRRSLVILPFLLLAGLAVPLRGTAGWMGFATLLIRCLLCLLILILLTNTTRFVELLRGLRRLGFPKIIVVNLSFLYRYFFVLSDEIMRMRQARDSRSVGSRGIRRELRTLGSMLGTLMVRSFERADAMYQAMLSRGFTGEFRIADAQGFSWRDPAFLAVVALYAAAVYYL